MMFLLVMMSAAQLSAQMAPARLLYNDGTHEDVLVISYSASKATYKTSEKSLNFLQVSKPKLQSVYFYRPEIFSEAMGLYHARNYAEAKAKFAECETTFKKVDDLPDNYSSLAGFYKMECSRRMFDLAALGTELEKYRRSGLVRENHLQQLEVYTFWEAVRLKDWERLDRLALSWRDRKLPAGLRVQVEYCHGLALDHLAQQDPGRLIDALNAYSRTMCANAASPIEIVLEAANNALRLYANDSGVKLAIKNWKTEDEKINSPGYQRLIEANSLVKFYQQVGFNEIRALAAEYANFLNYNPPQAATPPPAPKADENEGGGEAAASEPEADEPTQAEDAEDAEDAGDE